MNKFVTFAAVAALATLSACTEKTETPAPAPTTTTEPAQDDSANQGGGREFNADTHEQQK